MTQPGTGRWERFRVSEPHDVRAAALASSHGPRVSRCVCGVDGFGESGELVPGLAGVR